MSDFIPGITVVIPTIPPRGPVLQRAWRSVVNATRHWYTVAQLDPTLPQPVRVVPQPAGFEDLVVGDFTLACEVVVDEEHDGAARTRQRGLAQVQTEWVAFLDDDDEMLPDHLVTLYRAAVAGVPTDDPNVMRYADFVWSRFRIMYPDGSTLAGPAFLGEKAFSQWNDDDPCQTTITTLVRTELAQAAGGFAQFNDDGSEVDGHRRGEDHDFTLRCRKAGAVMLHVPEVTWVWHHWGLGAPGTPGNTSGMPDRW